MKIGLFSHIVFDCQNSNPTLWALHAHHHTFAPGQMADHFFC